MNSRDLCRGFMKPFARYGDSNLARIERRSANLIDRGEQNMDLPPCCTSRHAFFDRISRDAQTEALVVNLIILTFFKQPSYDW